MKMFTRTMAIVIMGNVRVRDVVVATVSSSMYYHAA